jgi:tetratricopeptide (TPR) repeat protein
MFRTGYYALLCGATLVALTARTEPQSRGAQTDPPTAAAPLNNSAPSIQSIQSLIRSQHYDQAQQAIQSALRHAPNDARLFTLQGIVFSIEKYHDDALAAFDHALRLSPNEPAALRGKVQLLYSADDTHAIPLLKRIVRSDPHDLTAHEMLAVLEVKQGDCAPAIDNFRLSGEVIHTHPGSLEDYASCLFANSEYEKAIPILQQLAALLPDRIYPRYDLAVVLVRTKQYQAALKLIEPLLESNPSDPDLNSLASDAYEQTGNTTKAVALARQAIVLDPENVSNYTAFAQLCLTHESYDVGIAMINAGLARIPNAPALLLARGLLYAQVAEISKAEADFAKAEQLDSGQSLSAYATDLAELELNHEDIALEKIRAQLKKHPDSALLHYILAEILDMRGDSGDHQASSEALQSALDAVRLKPDMVEAHDLLSSIYARSGHNDKAIEECRLALHDQPNDQVAMYHLLIALRHAGGTDHSGEIESLVARLSELKKSSRSEESQHKRFKIVEQEPPTGANNSPQ